MLFNRYNFNDSLNLINVTLWLFVYRQMNLNLLHQDIPICTCPKNSSCTISFHTLYHHYTPTPPPPPHILDTCGSLA